MKRRLFIGSVILALAMMASAHAQPAKIYRIGVVSPGGPYQHAVEGLRDGLKELGLNEGQEYVFHVRDTKGDLKAAEDAAKNLEQERVDLIFSFGSAVSLAAKRATTRTPIVFVAGSDPVDVGLVNSFARPEARLTGVYSFRTDLSGKRLEILKEIAPRIRNVAIFYNPDNPVTISRLNSTREAARRLGIVLIERQVHSGDELRASLETLKHADADALFPASDSTVQSHIALVIEAASSRKVPAIFNEGSLVVEGGLASYGVSYYAMAQLASKYVRKVLEGARPSDLPVERSERFELVLNARTAREIGITFSSSLLLRADQVIQ